MSHDLILKRDAAQATLEAWRGRAWALGSADCVRMAADHLARLGHTVTLPPSRSYRTVKGAVRALRKAGHATLAAAIDAQGLGRIAPSRVLPGDLVQMPGEPAVLGGLCVVLGNGRVLGFHEQLAGADVMQAVTVLNAWRVEVRR